MIVPIFNSMARIDKRVVEAAIDAGASRFDIMRLIIVPLSKSGIALGSIFVASIVMGDFFVTKVMSGGGSASVVGAFYEDISVLQYPGAAASAIILTVVLLVHGLADPAQRRYPQRNHPMSAAPQSVAVADARATKHAIAPSRGGRPWTFYVLARAVHILRYGALRPDDLHLHPVVSGCPGRAGVPDERAVAALVRRSVHASEDRRRQGRFRSLDQACDRGDRHHGGGLFHVGDGVPPAFSGRQYRVRADDRQPGGAGPRARHRGRAFCSMRSASKPRPTPRRWARSCPGRCRSACW